MIFLENLVVSLINLYNISLDCFFGNEIMSSWKYITLFVATVMVFNSCVNRQSVTPTDTGSVWPKVSTSANHSYGAYMAGRVAHLRKDFNNAANFYIEALKKDPNNKELLTNVYLILTSQGRIDEAAKYAQQAINLGDKNSFAEVIIAANQLKLKQYDKVQKTLKKIDGAIYTDFINPLISAWAYAGAGNKTNALKTLNILNKEPSLRALYLFHAGMINEYFNDTKAAEIDYATIVKEESLEMSFRALQIICNFYTYTNQKPKAIALINKYTDDKALADMMKRLKNKIAYSSPQNTSKIITSADMGASEAFFNIAATLRQGTGGIDLAHMFISLALYENPNYDLARLLLADVLENREMYTEANQQYDMIDKNSEAYYTAQLRKANNLVLLNDYSSAELLMRSLTLDSNNPQLYLDLGDVLRINGNQKEAIKYYSEAIKNLPKIQANHWVLFYARGISYEQNDQWDLAEKDFLKALVLSQNHYTVLNYLGYSWLKQGKNTEQAFELIVDAYNQAPQDGNVVDSLGWAFYKIGKYPQAVQYLEKASELEASNAVISDHLGDAYWMNGRKNEARFQWRHALSLKDANNELNKDLIQAKLQTGEVSNTPLTYDEKIIQEKIDLIATDD